MNKKGQIAIFIVAGILFLVIAIFLFYLNLIQIPDFVTQRIYKTKLSVVPIENFVESCIKEVSLPGIYLLASKGGYIYNYDNILNTEYEQISYHLIYNNDASPKKDFMGKELSRFVKESLQFCIKGFETFDYHDIETREIKVESSIADKEIVIKVNYPITIKQEEAQTTISDFSVDFPIRLGYILDIKNLILNKIKDSDMIDLDYLASQDVEVNILPYDLENIVYSIYDKQSNIGEIPFIFNFAVKSKGNSAPELEFIPDFVLTKGKQFTYQLIASDLDEDNLLFYSDDDLIDVKANTGIISFTPDVAGVLGVTVCVRDSQMAEDCEDIKFMVENE